MPKACLRTNQGGSLLIEAMLAGAVFSLLVMALVGVLSVGQEGVRLGGNRARAAFFAEEGLEATRNIRDAAYANLTTGTFGLSTVGNQWSFSGSSDVTDIFTRAITISDAATNVKTVTSTVTWQQNLQSTGSVSAVTYLANWMAAKVTIGNWALPLQQSTLDLAGNEDGLKVQTSGNYAYVVRNGGTPEFAVIDISNPALPSLVGSLTLSGSPTNIAVSGNYAYVSSTDNSQEVQIVNITTPSAPTLVGSLNLAGNTDARSIAVSGATAYVGRLSGGATFELTTVNVATPATPTLLGGLDLNGDINEVVILGSYAYVASTDNTQELQVVNVSTPAAPTLAGSLNLVGNDNALTITGFGSTLVLGRVAGSLSAISVATPAIPVALSSISLGGDVNDVALGNSDKYVFAGTSNAAGEFRVVDITTVATPALLGTVNAIGSVFGVAYNGTLDRAIGVSSDNATEVMIFRPQ